MRPDLSVIVLCYQSGDYARIFTENLITELEKNKILNYEIVLVGNYWRGSDDTTPAVVKKIAAENKRIIALTEIKEGMMGWDLRTGLKAATGNYLALIDGDGQVLVDDIVRVYLKIKNGGFDLVKTYRLKRGDSVFRVFISLLFNLLFKLFFPGLNARDINAKPKIIKRDAYQKLKLTADDWFIDAEIMIQARRNNFKIGEIPTVFLGLTGRRSFVRFRALLEFIKNLAVYRVKEFFI